jgi:PAS domain-containing protein
MLLCTTGPDGQRIQLNRRWYEFTGLLPGTGEGFGWLDAMHPEDRPGAAAGLRGANAAPTAFQADYRLHLADGNLDERQATRRAGTDAAAQAESALRHRLSRCGRPLGR